MFRLLATLAFAASFDSVWYDGKYTHAVEQVARQIIHHWTY